MTDVSTHYYGDDCVPPHRQPAREWLTDDTLGTVTMDFWSRYAAMKNALLAVLDLHQRAILPGGASYCGHCWNTNSEWPCPTVRAAYDALGIRDDTRREGYEYP